MSEEKKRIKAHYEAKIVMDFDVDMAKLGNLPEEAIKKNMAATTSVVEQILYDEFSYELGALDVIEICNNIEETE